MTLERAVIDLGEFECSPGLTWHMLLFPDPRVKRLDGLAFKPGFQVNRIDKLRASRKQGPGDQRHLAAIDAQPRALLTFVDAEGAGSQSS